MANHQDLKVVIADDKMENSFSSRSIKKAVTSDISTRIKFPQYQQKAEDANIYICKEHRPIGLATKNYDKPQLTTRTNIKKQIEHVEQRLYREDPVPEYFRAQISPILKVWRDNDATMFINTNAAQQVLKCLQENSCVTITATSGVGKTATLRHVALQMSKKDYDVFPVSDPGEIFNFYNPNKKTLFVIDDLCGNYHIDQADIAHWQSIIKLIKQILLNTETKMIAACRLQVYHDDKFKTLSVFKSCVCNLLSENMCLSKTEKQLIAELYLKTKASEIIGYHDLYEFFPLVCKLFYDNPKLDLLNYFQNPFAVYETEIDSLLKKGYNTKYSALALCVMFNNKLKEEILTEKVSDDTMAIITNTYEACRLNKIPSIPELKADLDSLKETFIRKEQNQYMIKHDKIFDFLVYYFGQRIINCLIKNADSALIKERFLLEKQDNIDQFTIVIPPQYHEMYIQRMIDDWSKGKCSDVFSNTNMKIPQFREKFLFHLNTLDMIEQTQLARISERHKAMIENINDDSYATALVHCCYISDHSLVQWCCNHGVDVNNCSYMGKSPIMIACEQGNTEIVQILLERGADCNIFNDWNQSPVMQAYTHCHIELVKVLLKKWTDYDKCNNCGQSPLMMACSNGHTNIVKMLLDRGADCNKCDNTGESSLFKASMYKKTEIVKMLFDKGADCNIYDNNGESPLFKASMRGYTEIVKMLLDKGADCNICNNNGESPLFMASLYGHTEIVKMLLDKGADCNRCNNNGESPLIMASMRGYTEIVKMLLDKGADCNICNNNGESPLFMASLYGHTEIVKMLLDKGSDCNICNNNGKSHLIMASMRGYTEIVKMLLDKGANCNICNNNGESPLFKASLYGHTEIVKMLLDKGADCNICNNNGESHFIMASMLGYTEIVKMLLDKGADCNICNNNGESPLIMASMRGYTEIVKMLLDEGSDCNICNNTGESLLIMASMRGYTEIVKMLLDKGADCNICNNNGESPLFKASLYGHTEIVKMLLDKGSDCNICNDTGESPLIMASMCGYTEIVKMLLDKGSDCNICNNTGESPLIMASMPGYTEIVKMLLDKGSDCNICKNTGESPLIMASMHGYTEIVRMLLDKGSDCNICNDTGESPLIMASLPGYTEIVKMLLDKGSDCNICKNTGESPLIMASMLGYTEIVKMLLDKGADCNICKNTGESPLIMASMRGNKEIVKMLIDKGSDCNKSNSKGRTPLIQASWHGRTEIIKMLLDKEADYNKCDKDGWSPVMTACLFGHTEVVELLIVKGADCNKCNNKGESPVMKACECGHYDTVKMLLDKGEDVDYNKCDEFGQSPSIMADKKDRTEIIKLLMDIKARNSVSLDILCDGIYLVCFTDKRLILKCADYGKTLIKEKWTLHDFFYQPDENSKLPKLKPEYQIIKSMIECKNKMFFDEKEVLHLAVIHKMSMLCRWLLANFSYDDNCLAHELSKSLAIGSNDVIKVISWKITREFYKRFKRNLNEKIVDLYPAYQCHCHCLTKGQQCLHVSKKLIVIESLAENINGIPDTFCNFKITIFKYSNINESSNTPQTEMKAILKMMSDLNASNSYSMFVSKVNGHVASSLFQQHRNLSLICPSNMKSSGYSSQHIVVPTSVCVQLFCHRKGIIPLGDNHFPTNIRGVPTDVLQGRGHFASTTLRVGDKIGTTTSCGTLGGFYHYFGRYECFITCAHVLLGLSKLIVPLDDMSHNNPVDVIFNQQQGNQICGNLIRRVFNHDDPSSTSIDAALVDIKSPDFKIDENDIIRDNSGSARRCECLGLTTPFVNKNYCDHKFLCCTDSNVTTLAPGAVSGKILKDVKLEHSSVKDVYLKDLGNAAATTNGALFHPLIMASPAHMQLPVGALTDRRIFTMYNQMVMNVPLKEGDSGSCIYITGNTPKNTGCVGMANSFCSGSGLALVTPIEEIIKAINR